MSYYTEDEEALLAKTKELRVNIIDSLIKGGIPDKTSELRILNEVANALDTQVDNSANIRARTDESDSSSKHLEVIKDILLNRLDANLPITDVKPEITEDLIPNDTVPGEMDIEAEALKLKDFTGDENGTI